MSERLPQYSYLPTFHGWAEPGLQNLKMVTFSFRFVFPGHVPDFCWMGASSGPGGAGLVESCWVQSFSPGGAGLGGSC